MKGKSFLIRTVTHYLTGRVVRVTKSWILLEDAAWIADTGRFADTLAKGTPSEVEPVPDGIIRVSRGAIVDIYPWNHALPREQK